MVRLHARLLRWLGPWADGASATPVRRRVVTIAPRRDGDRPFDAWVLSPADIPPAGAYLVAQGLHYDGPADPRMERFLRVLAHAGFLVMAPFLPDYTALRVGEGVVGDLARSFEALLALPERPAGVAPGIFSVSFGSLPALRLSSSPAYADRVGGLVLFGAYGDFGDTLRFCLGHDRRGLPRDPLNQPVVLLNLLDVLEEAHGDLAEVGAAWVRYVKATWGREEMKREERYRPIALRMAAEISDEGKRRLFLQGTGIEPGAMEICLSALAKKTERQRFLDPRPHLGGLLCPVHIVHGRDDDVIPFTQAEVLARAMPGGIPVATHLTGLYSHTRAAGAAARLSELPALAREGRTLLGILRAIVAAGTATGGRR